MASGENKALAMALSLMENRKPYGYTTWGCMWEKGSVQKNDFFVVTAGNETIPSQARVTAYWPDGSIKWTAHTADSGKIGKEQCFRIADMY